MAAAIGLIGIVGVAFGSFLSACAYRIPRGLSVRIRSFCPHCRTTLSWRQLMPIVGFIVSWGRCTSCRAPIPVRYPLFEAVSGAWAIGLFLIFGLTSSFLVTALFSYLMILVAIIDWEHLIIPNGLLLFGFAIEIAWTAAYDRSHFASCSIASVAALATMLIIMLAGNYLLKKETMGMGDIKLAALVAYYIGYPEFLFALWGASVLGLVVAFFARKEGWQFAPRNDGPELGIRHQEGAIQSASEMKLPFGAFIAVCSGIMLVLKESQILDIQYLWLTLMP